MIQSEYASLASLRRILSSHEAYAILGNEVDTWLAGGCQLLAEALKQVFPEGEIQCVYSHPKFSPADEAKIKAAGEWDQVVSAVGPDHCVFRLGNQYLDGDGVQTEQQLLKTWCDKEGLVQPRIGPYDRQNDWYCPPEKVKQVAEFLRQQLIPGNATFAQRTEQKLQQTGLRKTTQHTEQMDVTQTPQFQSWFGNSKIVDTDGKPLVVYHGAKGNPVTEFRPAAEAAYESYGAIWFATSREDARTYTGSSSREWNDNSVGAYYLKMEHPITTDEMGKLWEAWEKDNPTNDDTGPYKFSKYLQSLGYDGFIWDNSTAASISSSSTNFGVFSPAQIKPVLSAKNPLVTAGKSQVQRLYHGSQETFDGPLKPNTPPYIGGLGAGIYFAEEPTQAAFYGGRVYEADVQINNPLIIDAAESINYRIAPEIEEHYSQTGGYDSILVGESVVPFDVLIGGQWCEIRDGNDLENIGDWAKAAGHDAVIARWLRERSSTTNEVLIFDPKQIIRYHPLKVVDPQWDRRRQGPVQWDKTAAANEVVLPCADCGQSTIGEGYRIRDEIWEQALAAKPVGPHAKQGVELCIGCLEQRLGRQLTRADFDDISWNLAPEMQKYKSPRLLQRLGNDPESLAWLLMTTRLKDKQRHDGSSLVAHIVRVAMPFKDPVLRTIANLHEMIEDGGMTVEEIRQQFGDRVAAGVDAISRRPTETYKQYLARLAANPDAVQVKLADLGDNMQVPKNTPANSPIHSLQKRYRDATEFLRGRNKQASGMMPTEIGSAGAHALTHEKLMALIQAAREEYGHDFTGGDCGQFAIALVKFLESLHQRAEYFIEYGSHYKMYDHVAVEWNGQVYDGGGLYTRPDVKGYDEWSKEEYTVEFETVAPSPETESDIERRTDPDGIFAHRTDWPKILECLQKHWPQAGAKTVTAQNAISPSSIYILVHPEPFPTNDPLYAIGPIGVTEGDGSSLTGFDEAYWAKVHRTAAQCTHRLAILMDPTDAKNIVGELQGWEIIAGEKAMPESFVRGVVRAVLALKVSKVVIGGFHRQDCVRRLAAAFQRRGIPVSLDQLGTLPLRPEEYATRFWEKNDSSPKIASQSRPYGTKIDLNKLRQLFDDATEGMPNPELLNEVYSEWHDFLVKGAAEIQRDIDEQEFETDHDLQQVLRDVQHAAKLLDNKYASPYLDKLMALNKALMVWHRSVPILAHYLRQYYDKEVLQFLDWLEQRRHRSEKRPPANWVQRYRISGQDPRSAHQKTAQTEPPAPVTLAPDYASQHESPLRGDGAPMHDVTLNGIYPDDFYGPKGCDYYAGDDQREAMSKVLSVHNRPRAMLRVYRAIPYTQTNAEKIGLLERQKAYILQHGKKPPAAGDPGMNSSAYYDVLCQKIKDLRTAPEPPPATSDKQIHPGNWVTICRWYAHEHGRSNLNDQYRIVSKVVHAGDIYTDGNSLNEWGYDPGAYLPRKTNPLPPNPPPTPQPPTVTASTTTTAISFNTSLPAETVRRLRERFAKGAPLWRGQRPLNGRAFASDPGDLGRGKYFSSLKSRAENYGDISREMIVLHNPLVLTTDEAYTQIADQFGTISGQSEHPEHGSTGDHESRLRAAQAATDAMQKAGYDGVVALNNWHNITELEVVVFTANVPRIADWYSIATMIRYSSRRKDILVDLDETLAEKVEWPKIGKPIKGGQEALRKLREAGYKIRIFTCRLNQHHLKEEGKAEYYKTKERIEEWLAQHRIPYDDLVLWYEGKAFNEYIIDDKGLHFDGDWDKVVEQILEN